MTRVFMCTLAAWLGLLCSVAGQLPPPERTEETIRWLAVAMVAEAGWADPSHEKAEADHRAIYHVLRRRWPRLQKRWPHLYPRFVDVVQAYVAAFDPRTPKGGRVRWLMRLKPGMTASPEGWPDNARWHLHRVWWAAAVARATRCVRGEGCRDPHRGKALHWGGGMDKPTGCMVALPNAGTFNTFYAVERDCTRARKTPQ